MLPDARHSFLTMKRQLGIALTDAERVELSNIPHVVRAVHPDGSARLFIFPPAPLGDSEHERIINWFSRANGVSIEAAQEMLSNSNRDHQPASIVDRP